MIDSRRNAVGTTLGILCLGFAHGSLCAQPVRDSAGVRVARYRAGDTPAARWTLNPTPLLTIGGSSDGAGPTEFADIMGLARLSNGQMAIANMGTTELRFFSPTGTFLRSVGRQGQGPGEFNALFGLLRSGDTLMGIDNNGRAQVFGPDGKLLHSLTRPQRPDVSFPDWIGLLRDGRAVVRALDLTTDSAGQAHQVMGLIFALTLDGTATALARIPLYERLLTGTRPSFKRFGPQATTVAAGGRICAGYSATYEIRCWSQDGRLALHLVDVTSPRAITDGDRRLYDESYLAANKRAPPAGIASIKEQNRLAQYPDHAPAFSRFMLSTNGDIWVSDFVPEHFIIGPAVMRAPHTAATWRIFSPMGVWLSELKLPARFVPYDVGPDYVAGVAFGEDDVERVVVWQIRTAYPRS